VGRGVVDPDAEGEPDGEFEGDEPPPHPESIKAAAATVAASRAVLTCRERVMAPI
jgi:hypothetical protein